MKKIWHTETILRIVCSTRVMGTTLLLLGIFFGLEVFGDSPASVQYSLVREENEDSQKEILVIPYVFSSESMGFTYGVGGGAKGYLQDQLLLGGTVFGSADGAKGVVLGLWDLRIPGTERLYFTTLASYGEYPRQRAYAEDPNAQAGALAGRNDSGKDDFLESKGKNNWVDVRLEYMLPLGSAKNQGVANYRTRDGLLVSGASGGEMWNPMSSGITVLMLRQLNEYRSYEGNSNLLDRTMHPLELGILYDNTDFAVNPSRGSKQYLSVMQDFGWGESHTDWTFIGFEYSKYLGLGETDWARQRVLVLDFWTGSSPSWDETTDVDGNISLSGNPPFYEGAKLGGIDRMRGYPQDRFHDRSVIYTAAEYRYTPHYNPIKDIKWLDFLQMDWWQMSVFVEGGRVANEYTFSNLTSHWKADVGFGLRAMVAGGVLRFDMGFSDEGSAGWLMAGYPF